MLRIELARYADLAARARDSAAALQALGLKRSSRVALAVSAADELAALIMGALQIGAVPVILPVPVARRELAAFHQAVTLAVYQTDAELLVTSRHLHSEQLLVGARVRVMHVGQLDLASTQRSAAPAAPLSSDVALLEWSPEGIAAYSHAEWLDLLERTVSSFGLCADDVLVSWTAPYESAGVKLLLSALHVGCSIAFLPPALWVKHPQAGVELLARTRASVLVAPLAAYERCIDAEVDLSNVRVIAGVHGPIPDAVRAALIEKLGARAAVAVLPAHRRASSGLLAEGQRALWYLAQLAPDSRAYNVPLCLRIRSELNTTALRHALALCLERHAALRSVFPAHDGTPVRALMVDTAAWFESNDVSSDTDEALQHRIDALAAQGFDVEHGPLFRVRLLRRGAQESILLFVAHHLCVDTSSFLTLLSDLSALYPALASGRAAPALPAPVATYDDFVSWQRELLAGPGGQELRSYWRAQLADAPARVDMPLDRARPAQQSYRGARLPTALPQPLVRSLREFAERAQTTPYTVLLAALNALLAREARQREVVVGTPVLGRSRASFASVVGYFINTLPIRVQVDGSLTFAELVRATRDSVLAALDHQDLPFSQIVEQAGLARDPSRAPLCQVMFQHQTHRADAQLHDFIRLLTLGGRAELAGLELEHVDVEQAIAQCDLRLDLREHGDDVAGFWEYNTDLFERTSVERWNEAWLQLLAAGLSQPHAPIADPMREIAAWNDTYCDFPVGNVPAAIARIAAQMPDAPALRFGATELSYQRLAAHTERLACALRARGVGRDVLVAVCMERSIELVIALLAIMKAGGAYVPLEPGHPRERLGTMLEDIDPALIVADDHCSSLLRALSAAPLVRTSELALIAREDMQPVAAEIEPADLAYVIYTSGSTGVPKGVCCTHEGLWNRLCWMQAEYGLTPVDRVLQKTPYSFDVSVWELFWPLMTGACLVVARPGGHKDTQYLLREIAEQRITTMHFVPSMLQAFVDEAGPLPARTGLKRVFCSGEALPHTLMERFMGLLPEVELHNLYGPTEASIDVTYWRCQPHPRKVVPIGRPIANTQIYLLDEHTRPVPVGEVGELYIGGVGLARGYHRRPELTRERFIPNPIPGAASPRLYKTGDLARYDRDGNIEYLGRNDQQIKLRGFRIELGEIEAVLCEHPSVKQCIVAVRELAGGGKRLEAFVVPRSAVCERTEAMRAWLSTRLPEYMVPAELHEVAVIPLSHNGKADRRALLSAVHGEKLRRIVAPSDHVERILATAFSEVLGVAEISIHDNFFELGGDSIRSLQVRAHARRHGVLFDTAQLLEHQSIASLAGVLTLDTPVQETKLAAFALLTAAERETLAESEYEDAFPTTRLQLGMLYHSQLTADSWAYYDTLSFELELTAPLDERVMRDALSAVVQCHPMLRASFELARYGRPLTLIAREVTAPLTWIDLRHLSPEQAEARVAEHRAQEQRRGYRIEQAPLFRLSAQLLSERCARITLSFHHAIMDGWSAATLQHDLLREYLRRSSHPELPAVASPAHGFGAFVELEARALEDSGNASRDYWLRALADHELVPLPRWDGLQSGGHDASRLVRAFPEALRAGLTRIAAELHASPKHLLLAAHVRVLAAFTGAEQVNTGLVSHGRPELSESERIVGLFLNTLPLCVDLGHSSWAQLVASLASKERELFEHRRYPLHEIQRVCGAQSLFDSAFNYVSFHLYHDVLATGALRMSGFEVHENTEFGTLASFVDDPRTAVLALHLEYDTRRIARAQAEQLADAYLLAIAALVSDVHRSAKASSVIMPAEQEQLLIWEDGGGQLASDAPVHASFEATRARTPSAVAAQYDDARLSYEQLGAWSDRIAAHLSQRGAQPGEVVAICAEPGLPRVAAVLGVLKAGAAYLPLDPSFPEERLGYMLERASVKRCLVTPSHRAAPFLSAVQCLDLCEQPALGPLPPVTLDRSSPAYVIFTSGSTGRPKGIVMTHGPLSNLIAWQCTQSSAADGDRTAHYSAFSFDVSFQELFSTWASGGRLVIVPEQSRKDTRAFLKLLREASVARVFVPVVVLHQLAAVAEELMIELPELREVITAGEQLEITAEVRAFFLRHPRCRLENQYGPTETHVATAHRLPSNPETWPLMPAIGRPLPAVRAYVLDETRARVPVGVPGELFLAGACVAAGYVADSALTAERFLQDPHEPNARMYSTGDRVRWLPDGTLEYLGRRDSQVKVRGYRVELAEVEAALIGAGKGAITRAVVVAPAGRQQLQAYVICKTDITWDANALRRELSRTLPEPMVPALITRLDALPLTPTGKVDRRALAQQVVEPAAVVRIQKLPQDELERALCLLWEEVLGVPAGTDLDFFEAGGESLRAVRLMARIQRDYRVELPISALIEARTVQSFAVTLREAMSGATRAQRRLVQLHATQPGEAPWFLIHPIGGNILCYMPLARRLGRGCYGLQARGLDGRSEPHVSVRDMAREYAAELQAQQPNGIIHLAGWSFGGYVAVEVAQQLQDSGRQVAPLVIMDTIAALRWHAELNDSDILEFMAMELLGTRADDGLLQSLAADELATVQKLERVSSFARAQGVASDAGDVSQLARVQKLIATNFRSVYQHTPPRYSGEVVLLRCTDPMPGRLRRLHDLFGSVYHAADNGWGAYCESLRVIPVRGNHLSLVAEPYVSQVTDVLDRCAQGLPPDARRISVSA